MKSYKVNKVIGLEKLISKRSVTLNADIIFRELEQAKKRREDAQQKYDKAFIKAMVLRHYDDPLCEEVLRQFDNRDPIFQR